jgi:hypothetical protein
MATFRTVLASFVISFVAVAPAISRAEDAPDSKPDAGGQKAPAIDPQKEKDVRKLLELSGAAKLGVQVMDQMLTQMRRLHPDVPPDFWDAFKKEANADELTNLVVPIYANHFTDDEIKELIKFYESPIGQKLVREQPPMMRESMQVGQQWGFQLGQKIAKRLKEKGYV